jgi:uncharacterized membrane protein
VSALSPQATVRSQARQALKGHWATAVIAFLILMLPLSLIDGMCTAIACTVVTLVSEEATQEIIANLVIYPVMLVLGLLLSPIFNGYVRLFTRNASEGRMDIRDLTYFFYEHRYGHALRFNLSFALRMIIPTTLFFLPVAAYQVIAGTIGDSFTGSVIYRDFHFILCVMSVMLVLIYSMKHFFAFTVFAFEPERNAGEIFKLGRQINRAHSFSAVKLLFSYTPWILLCLTILPMLYVIPYLSQGMCIGAVWMRAAYHETVEYPVRYAEGNL